MGLAQECARVTRSVKNTTLAHDYIYFSKIMAEAVTVAPTEQQDVTSNHQCPTFNGYEKMSDTLKDFTGSFKSVKNWVVLEKIHGSNFSLTAWKKSDQKDDIGVKLGKRTSYLCAEDKFYKIETQLDFQASLKACTIKAWKIVNGIDDIGDVEAMTVFGELFGGYYPHSSVSKVPDVCPVQKEVAYCPEVKFCGFDIALFRNGKDREYMDYDQVMSVLSEAGFMYSKPLSICSFEEAISFKIGFVTHLPTQFKLPPIDDNLAEGVVIKPMQNLHLSIKKGFKRVIVKRKIAKFSERKAIGSPPKKKTQKDTTYTTSNNFELLKYEIFALVTNQRLDNAISKIGLPYEAEDKKWSEIREMMEADVMETLQDDNDELWEGCSHAVRDMLTGEAHDQCKQLVTLYKQKV